MTATRGTRLGTVSAAALLVSVLTASGSSPASADTELAFDAVGEATGVISTITNTTIPAGIVIEGSGPTAQARLSSLGTSTAFAALPYPGDTAANLPGTVTALTQVPLPDYPLYVRSESGTDPKSATYPGATLNAASTGNRSAAHATAATDAVGYFADTTVTQDKDGSVSVLSVARQNGLDIGGLVTASNVVSTSRADLDTAGGVTTKSSLTVGRFIAPGLEYTVPAEYCIPTQACQALPAPLAGLTLSNPNIGLDADGFFITLPIAGPQRFPIPAETFFSALKNIGVGATYQKEIKTKNSVVAATLALSTVLPSLPPNDVFNGPTPVTYTLGRTAASVSGQVTDTGSGSIDIPIGGVETPPFTSGGSGPVEGGLSPLAPGGTGAGTLPSIGTGESPSVATPGQGAQLAPALAASGREPLQSVFWFYLVLVGVGLVGSAAGQVIRYMGVRASWAS
jgi:hypothetical protein